MTKDQVIEELQKALDRTKRVIDENPEAKRDLEKKLFDDLNKNNEKAIEEIVNKKREKKEFLQSFREKFNKKWEQEKKVKPN